MSNIEKLIKDVAFDTISVITIWQLLHFASISNYKNIHNDCNYYDKNMHYIYIISPLLIGFGSSILFLGKYIV
jgi:hypothetical protein